MILKDFPEEVWKIFMIMELRPVEQPDSHDHGRLWPRPFVIMGYVAAREV
jgi:hypothetical protein